MARSSVDLPNGDDSGKIARMRRLRLVFGLVQAVLVIGMGFALRSGRVPLGVPGEWEWLRVKLPAEPIALVLGGAAVVLYAGFAFIGFRSLERSGADRQPRRWVEGGWLLGLLISAILVQGVVQEAAPTGHGLAKWALALINPGSSGYYTVAKTQIEDPARFLVDYPAWIRTQGSLHIGTHPPGLFLEAYASLKLMEQRPEIRGLVLGLMPESVDRAFRVLGESQPIPLADRASMALTGALTLLACSATLVPLYLLARVRLSASASWATSACWPLVPAALLFQPSADTAFPLLVMLALLFNAWSERGWAWSLATGLTLAVGMQFSLVFLAAGLIVAIVIAADPTQTWQRRLLRFLATGVGFLGLTALVWAVTRANPFLIWWANQANHARFYVDFPRSYLAWLIETPFEVAIAIGLPVVLWIGIGARKAPREAWATVGVLLILLVTGRSLSEVARLWIPFFPVVLLALGAGFARVADSGKVSLAWTLAWMGMQTLILQTLIQVVYPV